jgi:hypothetical protein
MTGGEQAGVRGTPTFFVGLTEPNSANLKAIRRIIGAQPYAAFKAAIVTPTRIGTSCEQERHCHCRRCGESRQDFRPLPKVIDSTRRKSLIRWQKRAAVWEHGSNPVQESSPCSELGVPQPTETAASMRAKWLSRSQVGNARTSALGPSTRNPPDRRACANVR